MQMTQTPHRVLGVVALLWATISSVSAAPLRLTPQSWMERSRMLGSAVKIDDLHYAQASTADGRAGVAVVGRVVNESGATLSLLAIHLALTEPTRVAGNVPVIVKPEQLGPGASKTFAFMIEPVAAEGFAPLGGAPSEWPRLSAAAERGFGRITAYVTYAGE